MLRSHGLNSLNSDDGREVNDEAVEGAAPTANEGGGHDDGATAAADGEAADDGDVDGEREVSGEVGESAATATSGVGEKQAKKRRRSKGEKRQRVSHTKRQRNKHRETAAAEDGGR